MDKLPFKDFGHPFESKYVCQSCEDNKDDNSYLEKRRTKTDKEGFPAGNNRTSSINSIREGNIVNQGRQNCQASSNSGNLLVKGTGNLGSSFGGVFFKQSNLVYNRKHRSSECRTQDDEINQLSVKQTNNVESTEHLTGHNYSCRNILSAMFKGDIDRQLACSSNKSEKTDLTKCVCVCGRYSDVGNQPNLPDHQTHSSHVAEATACDCRRCQNVYSFQLGRCQSEPQAVPEEDIDCLESFTMGDGEYFNGRDSGRGSCGRRINSGRNSLDSSVSVASDNVFFSRRSTIDSSSLSDITSVSSLSSSHSNTRDTNTSRMRFELRHGAHHLDNGATEYLTPRQRGEKEIKLLRKERSQLLRENEEKEAEISTLKSLLEAMKDQMETEKEKEMADVVDRLKVSEREKFEVTEELCKVQEELTIMDAKYVELKREMTDKEDKFEEQYLNMYKKGQLAAMFEREQELEMLASSQKSRVSVRELTRKLSRTELELAKWQGLKLGESYFNTDTPGTQAEATLGFLKDAFFHFLTDKSDSEDHLRAMIKIFKYSESQMARIRKGLEEFKHLDKKKVFLK